MSTTHSYIGLGANLGDTRHTLRVAADAIAALPGSGLHKRSSLYKTPAWGLTEQPEFLNAVVMLETTLAPLDLLHALLQIEQQHGRNRESERRWGPRTLDLDILLYGSSMLELPTLSIPHPHLYQRAFALVPLLEIAPDIQLPGIGPADNALRDLLPIEHPPIPTASPSDWSCT